MLLTKSVLVAISSSNRAFYENLDYILPSEDKITNEIQKLLRGQQRVVIQM